MSGSRVQTRVLGQHARPGHRNVTVRFKVGEDRAVTGQVRQAGLAPGQDAGRGAMPPLVKGQGYRRCPGVLPSRCGRLNWTAAACAASAEPAAAAQTFRHRAGQISQIRPFLPGSGSDQVIDPDPVRNHKRMAINMTISDGSDPQNRSTGSRSRSIIKGSTRINKTVQLIGSSTSVIIGSFLNDRGDHRDPGGHSDDRGRRVLWSRHEHRPR